MYCDVVSIGEPVIDFFPERERDGVRFKPYPGGGAANVLAEVCAMGQSALLLGVVGADRFGDYLMEELKKAGISLQGMRRTSQKKTGIGFVELAADGERNFLHYRDYHIKTSLWNECAKEAIEHCRIFHYTSVSLVDPIQREESLRAAALAEQAGRLVSFDVNYRKDMWEDKQLAKTLFEDCIRQADIVKLSEEERAFLCETSNNEKAAEDLAGGREKVVLISLGANGSFVWYPGGSGYCGTVKVKAKDTTGCGDAFMGAVLANVIPWIKKGRLGEIPLEELKKIAMMANVAGAACATRYGSLSVMADRREVMEMLEGR